MSFGKIKLDKADRMFSRFIRLRDKRCIRCGRPGDPNADGEEINGLQCSHYFGRGRESTRFDIDNCDSLCAACHRIWGSDNKEAYREFKIRQLGYDEFQKLRIRSEMIYKKDRKVAYIYAKKLVEDLKI